MDVRIELKNQDDWFDLKKEMAKYPGVRTFVLTGARGCGKTFSTHDVIRDEFEDGRQGLYIRNSKRDIPTARQYFSFLNSETTDILLGTLGASTIVRQEKSDSETFRDLIGYSLFLGDYEVLKSAKRKIDYVVYEEFSSFINGSSINRIFALTELRETIRQTNPNFLFIAISNNIFYDDLFDNLLEDDEFVHFQIVKKTVKSGIKNTAIRSYLEGEYLVPDIVINLSSYRCQGYVTIANSRLYLFYNEFGIPNYVLSSTGTGNKIPLDTEAIDKISRASYRSLKDRNKCEFLVGLIRFSGAKLKA